MAGRGAFQKLLREDTLPQMPDKKPRAVSTPETRQTARQRGGGFTNITAPDDNDLDKAGRNSREKANLTASVNDRGTQITAPKELASFEVEPTQEGIGIVDNVLNNYINVQYHMAFSMVPLQELRRIQLQIPLSSTGGRTQSNFDDIAQSIQRNNLVTVASTGDVFGIDGITLGAEREAGTGALALVSDPQFADAFLTREVSGRNYFNIKSLTIENYMAPSTQNPYIAQSTPMKMTLVEPHGLKFFQDTMTELAKKLGYGSVGIGRTVYRLDIFFSGYDAQTGEWIPQIQLSARNKTIRRISYFVIITGMEAEVDHKGTTYDLSLVPVGMTAIRPEEAVLEANSIFTGSDSPEQGPETFGGFLDQLEILMSNAKKNRTHGQIKRNYKFFAPELLRKQKFYSRNFFSRHNFLKEDAEGGSVVTVGRDIDVMTLLGAALRDIEKVWDDFTKKEKDPRFVEPRIHWNVRFNVLYEGRGNENLHDFDEMTLEYILEPYATFKKAYYDTREQLEEIVSADAQVERISKMAELGMIERVYDYIHTSENTEVINFDLKLKQFFFRTLALASDTDANIGSMTPISAGNTQTDRNNIDLRGAETNPREPPEIEAGTGNPSRIRNKPVIDSSLQRIFGSGIDRPSSSCQIDRNFNPFDIITGGFNDASVDDYYSSIGSSSEKKRDTFELNLNDYLRNDLLRIEDLQVRGDPIWLLSPYANESIELVRSPALTKEDRERNIGGGSIIRTATDRFIFLRMFEPVQDDLMNPNRQVASTACSIIGGFYQVLQVQSTFEGGKFTQKIIANVADHLNFSENFVLGRNRTEEDEAEEEGLDTTPASSEGATPQEPDPNRFQIAPGTQVPPSEQFGL